MLSYPSSADHIAKHTYRVTMSQAEADVTYNDEALHLAVYEPLDIYQTVNSRITIHRMVTIYHRGKTSFEILIDEDVLKIRHEMDAYLNELHDKGMENNPEVIAYLRKFLKWRTRIETLSQRVLNRHPRWKRHYAPQYPGMMQTMLNMISVGTGQNATYQDFKERILKEPTPLPSLSSEIQRIQDRNKSSNDTSKNTESSFSGSIYGSGGIR
jgi:hypothetical protein